MPLRTIAVFYIVNALAIAQPPIPDTPAGHTLQAWLDAFDSGDPAKLEAYAKTIDPSQSVDGMISFRRQTYRENKGGLKVSIDSLRNGK